MVQSWKWVALFGEIYSQSRDDVPCILNKLIEVSHLAAFGELICQIDLQVMQLIWDGHVYNKNLVQ